MSCPKCESDKIDWINEEFDGDYYYSMSQCGDCGTVFQDVYEYLETQVIVEENYEEEE